MDEGLRGPNRQPLTILVSRLLEVISGCSFGRGMIGFSRRASMQSVLKFNVESLNYTCDDIILCKLLVGVVLHAHAPGLQV